MTISARHIRKTAELEAVGDELAIVGKVAGDYVLLQDQKASGTAGGTFTSGAWQTRVLNTIAADTTGVVTLSANQFTLPAGTYRIEAKAPAFNVDRHEARLQNITDATTVLSGTSGFAVGGNQGQESSFIFDRFTIASAKTFEIQHRCQSTAATNGFGVESGSNFAVAHETYTSVTLIKE